MTLPPGPDPPALAQAVAYHRDPLGVLLRARARYGPRFTLRVTKPIVLVSDPAVMADANAGAARRAVLPLASPRSLFGADGAEHTAERARWENRFHQISDDAIAEIAERHIAAWPRGRPFRLLERMRDIASDVFGRLILRADDPDAYVAAVRRMLRTPGNPPLPVPAALDPVFQWRAAPLRALLGEGADRMIVVCAAGQEPPAIALANVGYEWARRGGELTPRFVDETLRLRPSASAALREIDGETRALSSLLAHHDPKAFPDPHVFRTDRDYDHPLYMPFGGGVRRCVGEPLARAQLRAIPPLLPRLKAVHPRPERMVVRGTVLVPHRSALVTAT
ncbi:cytochrome P450 [Solirubrobacter sp. CPCC 204708]|uniref:Cytochrome P450 n=1 Tax=Solirubrobacter deserti TaxID=2282478 RepID=A0ABT4RHN0_9ACTN|nr:cytochrome P450 [Solirubrobacter deserti]MBE2316521.1 cytochrome P450 [Solirubrobacter deserti]MDA0138054.1 cytochrome P450 [Solirubrobacter deserti]